MPFGKIFGIFKKMVSKTVEEGQEQKDDEIEILETQKEPNEPVNIEDSDSNSEYSDSDCEFDFT